MLKRYSDQALVESAARLMTGQRSKPQPVQTVPQPGSMEWFDAQKKKG